MSSTSYSGGALSPRFVFTVLIPVAIIGFVAYEIWMWLQKNGAILAPWAIGVAVLLVAVGLTWAVWRVRIVLVDRKRVDDVRRLEAELLEEQVIAMRKHNELTDKGKLMLEEARVNRDQVEIRFGSNGSIQGFKTEPMKPLQGQHVVIEELRTQMQQLLAMQSVQALPSPDHAIADIVHYRDVEREVPSDLSLLGIYPENGNLEIVSPDVYKTAWFVGASSSGKTNTVYGKVADAVRWGAKIIICDIHGNGNKQDSLTNQLQDFHGDLLIPVASSRETIKNAVIKYMREFMARREGGVMWTQKWLIVIDEVNALAKMPIAITEPEKKMLFEEFGIKIKDDVVPFEVLIKALVELCGYEGRGFGMFGYFISQKAAHLAWLRNAVTTVFAHRMIMDSEAILVANGDRKMAELIKAFKRGRTLVYGVDIQEPIILQQALYHQQNRTPVVNSTAISERSMSVPSNQSVMTLERPQESAQEADGTITTVDADASSFELKKILNDIGRLKAKGLSNAAILRQFQLQDSGRNNVNLTTLLSLSGDNNVTEN